MGGARWRLVVHMALGARPARAVVVASPLILRTSAAGVARLVALACVRRAANGGGNHRRVLPSDALGRRGGGTHGARSSRCGHSRWWHGIALVDADREGAAARSDREGACSHLRGERGTAELDENARCTGSARYRGTALARGKARERLSEAVPKGERKHERAGGRTQTPPQSPARAEEQGFDRRPRKPERGADLSVSKSVDVAQDDCLALLLRKLRERSAKLGRQHLVLLRYGGSGGLDELVVGERERLAHPGHDPRAAFVARDSREPRRIVTNDGAAEQRPVRADERLLSGVLGLLCVAEEDAAET